MTQRLSLEVLITQRGEWRQSPPVKPGDRDGTLSDNHQQGRDVYLFGVDPIKNQGYIKKSELGFGVTDSGLRTVSSASFIIVAALNDRESHELTVQTDNAPGPHTVRFTYFGH